MGVPAAAPELQGILWSCAARLLPCSTAALDNMGHNTFVLLDRVASAPGRRAEIGQQSGSPERLVCSHLASAEGPVAPVSGLC